MSHRDKEFLAGAYGLDSLEEAMAFYNEWAADYDEQMEAKLNYVAPRRCAEHLARHLGDTSTSVVDIGCGTGLTGLYLYNKGFGTIDGIDLADAMLAEAGKRGFYRNLIKADLTEPLDIPDAAYGAAMSSGTFTLGHVGSEPVPEILRILEPGGLFACTIHADIWGPKGFEEKFRAAEAEGRLEFVAIERGHFFTHLDPVAMYCIFRRL